MYLPKCARSVIVLSVLMQLFLSSLIQGMHHHGHYEAPHYEPSCHGEGPHMGHILMAGLMGKMMSKHHKKLQHMNRMRNKKRHKHIPIIIPIPIHQQQPVHHHVPEYHHHCGYK